MKLSSKILLICGFCCGLMAYNFRFFLWPGSFYHFIALEFVILYSIIWNELKGRWRIISGAMTLVCFDSLIDEIFFDPTYVGLNEYIGFGLIILITLLYERHFRGSA